MSIILGVGVAATTITAIYLGRKGWHAFHKAVGITPGVLIYQDSSAPLTLSKLSWQQLSLHKNHLKVLTDRQLRQLQSIDEKVAIYQNYQQNLKQQNKTPIISEDHFILHKLIYTRLPEILDSHYRLMSTGTGTNQQTTHNDKQIEAAEVLQQALDSIEGRLDGFIRQIDTQNLQDLRVMKRYIDSQS